MNSLLGLYPGHWLVHHAMTYMIQSSVLILIALGISRIFTWNAISRYNFLLAIWIAIILLPFATMFVHQSNLHLYASSFLLSESTEQNVPSSIAIHTYPEMEFTTSVSSGEFAPVSRESIQPSLSKMQLLISLCVFVWVCGSIYLTARLLSCFYKLHRIYKTANPCISTMYTSSCSTIAEKLGLNTVPSVEFSEKILCPGIIGYLRPKIIIPQTMVQRLTGTQFKQIVLHEMAHIRRNDQWIVLFQKMVTILFWPHMLIHILNRQLIKAQEEVCDNYVLESTDSADYSRTLVDVAEIIPLNGYPSASVGLYHNRFPLRERVTQLLNHRRVVMRKSSFSTITCIALFTILAVSALSLTHPAWGIDPEIRERIKAEKAEIKEILKQGRISKLEAKLRIAESKLRIYEEALHGDENESLPEEAREHLERLERELDEAVEAGKLSEDEARERFEYEERLIRERVESAEHDDEYDDWPEETREHLINVRKELGEAVEAGRITEDEATEKFDYVERMIRERIEIGEYIEGETAETHEQIERNWDELQRLVRKGEISEDEAEEKFDYVERMIRERIEIGEYIERETAETHKQIERTWNELQRLVRKGEISEDEAEERITHIKKEAERRMNAIRENAHRKMHGEEHYNIHHDEIERELDEIGRRIKAAVRAGEISEEDARKRYEHAKKELYERTERHDHDTELESVERRIKAAVREGRLNREEAEKKLDEYKQQQHMIEMRKKYSRVETEIKKAVEAGKLSERDARKKLEAIRKEMFGGDQGKEIDVKAIGKRIERAVKEGRLSRKEADEKYREIRRQMSHDEDREEIDWDGIRRRIENAVKEGKMTREEATAKYKELREQQ
jgi:beta-lactamase regulating signal transducer with metallopeptidase domain/polyhydroxyalkanoate synthesis regulator phasin